MELRNEISFDLGLFSSAETPDQPDGGLLACLTCRGDPFHIAASLACHTCLSVESGEEPAIAIVDV